MVISERLQHAVLWHTYRDNYTKGPDCLYCHLNFSNNNLYKKSLVVDFTKDEVIIPALGQGIVNKAIIAATTNNKILSRVLIPLFNNCYTSNRRTFDSIIKEGFESTSFLDRVRKFNTPKDGGYYISKGLILDKNYNPLLLCCLVATKNKDNKYVAYKHRCYINPKVFTETTLINTGIIKKLIPLYTTNEVMQASFDNGITMTKNRKVEVVVSDYINELVVAPNKPSSNIDMDEALNNVIVDNIDEIMSYYES